MVGPAAAEVDLEPGRDMKYDRISGRVRLHFAGFSLGRSTTWESSTSSFSNQWQRLYNPNQKFKTTWKMEKVIFCVAGS